MKETLAIAIEAAKKRDEPGPHHLFSGPPGLGKTTLARIIAREMGAAIRTTSGPVLDRPGDLAAPARRRSPGVTSSLSIDPPLKSGGRGDLPGDGGLLHRCTIGEGPGRGLSAPLEVYPDRRDDKVGLLASPLRDGFGFIFRLSLYEVRDLAAIIRRSAGIMQTPITPKGALEIAKRSRGTPRIANRLLRRVRDFALVRRDGSIDEETADLALTMLGIDQLGLDERPEDPLGDHMTSVAVRWVSRRSLYRSEKRCGRSRRSMNPT